MREHKTKSHEGEIGKYDVQGRTGEKLTFSTGDVVRIKCYLDVGIGIVLDPDIQNSSGDGNLLVLKGTNLYKYHVKYIHHISGHPNVAERES